MSIYNKQPKATNKGQLSWNSERLANSKAFRCFCAALTLLNDCCQQQLSLGCSSNQSVDFVAVSSCPAWLGESHRDDVDSTQSELLVGFTVSPLYLKPHLRKMSQYRTVLFRPSWSTIQRWPHTKKAAARATINPFWRRCYFIVSPPSSCGNREMTPT